MYANSACNSFISMFASMNLSLQLPGLDDSKGSGIKPEYGSNSCKISNAGQKMQKPILKSTRILLIAKITYILQLSQIIFPSFFEHITGFGQGMLQFQKEFPTHCALRCAENTRFRTLFGIVSRPQELFTSAVP